MTNLSSYSPPVQGNGVTTPDALRAALRCGRSGCDCRHTAGNVHCPAHEDEKPSLSVGLGRTGGVVVRCQAGCSQEAVLAALRARGLWAPRARRSARDIVATYPYQDAEGRLLYEVVRFAPKGFAQRRPDPTAPGGWRWGLDGVRRVPYRLAEVLAAAKAGRVVFVAEGEKDVEALRALGLAATTNPGGAEKWRAEYSEALRGAHVVVLPDNDEPGRRHAEQVARALSGVAVSVRVVELPDLPAKGDVSDWLAAGGTREALEELARAAPTWAPAAVEATEPAANHQAGRKHPRRREPTQAEELRALFDRRYRLGRSPSGEPYAVPLAGPPIVRTFRGGRASLKGELARAYAREHGRGPCAEALADCLLLLEAEAEEAPRQEVALRVATRQGPECWLDLGGPDGRLIRVTREGWTLEEAAPVLFRRSELTGELPEPARPGDLEPWLRLMNVGDDDRSAILAWLVTVLLGLPVPILLLRGPAGAAKSTAARMIARLLDPGPAPLRAPPRDMEGWAVGAQGSLIVPCDNVTTIPEWWSDALCRAVTGDGVVRRALYTDSALSVLAFRRAVILTAIDAGALRGDLTDRLLSVELAEIRERDRRDDADVEAAFGAAWPAALGGLLTLAAQVLDLLPFIRLDRRPRMADFGRVLAAVDAIRRSRALEGYTRARLELAREAAEGDAVGARILAYMADRAEWRGTAAELLAALQPADKPPRGWPETARALAGRLRRLVGPLRAAGIEVAFERMGHTRVRTVTLTATTGGGGADR